MLHWLSLDCLSLLDWLSDSLLHWLLDHVEVILTHEGVEVVCGFLGLGLGRGSLGLSGLC